GRVPRWRRRLDPALCRNGRAGPPYRGDRHRAARQHQPIPAMLRSRRNMPGIRPSSRPPSRARQAPRAARRENGFTLIEVLVTVIVLAIGLLGLAALQFSGLRYTHSAYQRSQATILTNDIIDRMRVNR